ncbi:MAG: L-threonylcarbamoyladenylate synthase [candidate division WOR-3 bacterium]
MTLNLDPARPDPRLTSQAAAIVARGGIVIFPTETVYGIGADLRRPDAIERVCQLKQRPAGQPFLIHCSTEIQLVELVQEIPAPARRLMATFWPGPLALVFKAKSGLPNAVTGPNNTVGIRMVAHPVFCALATRLGSPLAGTSANLHGRSATSDFTKLSPQLVEAVDVALNAGVCGTDLASTVLDMTHEPPVLLRRGAVPVQAIETALRYPVGNTDTHY